MNRREYAVGAAGLAACALSGCAGVSDVPGAAGNGSNDGGTDDGPDCAATATIESGGMEPALSPGDEVCLDRYDSYEPVRDPSEPGVVTAAVGAEIGYEMLGGTGDVIRYYPDGNEDGQPVIARAARWEDGSYVTSGDANEEPYPWDAPVDAVTGVVRTVL